MPRMELPHDPDPEATAGEVIPDPWEDPEQTDWSDTGGQGGEPE